MRSIRRRASRCLNRYGLLQIYGSQLEFLLDTGPLMIMVENQAKPAFRRVISCQQWEAINGNDSAKYVNCTRFHVKPSLRFSIRLLPDMKTAPSRHNHLNISLAIHATRGTQATGACTSVTSLSSNPSPSNVPYPYTCKNSITLKHRQPSDTPSAHGASERQKPTTPAKIMQGPC
jgi:hypothetical protein